MLLKSTRATAAALAIGLIGVATIVGAGLAGSSAPTELTPASAELVEGLREFRTLETAITVDPTVFGDQQGTLRGVLRVREDGVMALDMAMQNRVTFDGQRFTQDRHGEDFEVAEFWSAHVDEANAIFRSIRNGEASWDQKGPGDYGVPGGNLVGERWLELQLPEQQGGKRRVFFLVGDHGPSEAWVYRGQRRTRMVVFRSWQVNTELKPDLFEPEAPASPVDMQYTHIPEDGTL